MLVSFKRRVSLDSLGVYLNTELFQTARIRVVHRIKAMRLGMGAAAALETTLALEWGHLLVPHALDLGELLLVLG